MSLQCSPLQVMLPLLHQLLPHLKKQVLRRSHVLVGVRGWLSMRKRRLMDLMVLQPTMKQVIVVEPNLCSCKSKTWLVQALGLGDSQFVLPLLRPLQLLTRIPRMSRLILASFMRSRTTKLPPQIEGVLYLKIKSSGSNLILDDTWSEQ